jgi:hypothetical protein
MMSKLVFRSGEYLDHYIEDVLEHDPAYIVEMYSTKSETGITEDQYNRALRMLDEWDGGAEPGEDMFFLESVTGIRGDSGYD